MNHTPYPSLQRGFSLVELLVSVVVAMLALMFATQMVTGGEKTKQAALSGSDSMQNGMLAMFSISNDANQAGYGLNDPLLAGCDTTMLDTSGYTLMAPATGSALRPLAAAIIESNGTAPDRITFYSGSGLGGTVSVRLTTTFTGGAALTVDRFPYGFAKDDVMVIAPESGGAKCSLAQVSVQPTAGVAGLRIDSTADTRFNSAGLGGNIYTGGSTRIFNLGPPASLSLHTWSVKNGYLQLRATDLADSTGTEAATVADNIVSIKAQYGFDTRAGSAFTPELGMQVTRWSNTMIDVDADGTIGGAGVFQRVVALRIAVVARSKSPERPLVAGACTATTAPPTLFSMVQPQGVAAVSVVDLNLVVAGDTVDWKCYRYRVFETIVPIRNNAWRPTAWTS